MTFRPVRTPAYRLERHDSLDAPVRGRREPGPGRATASPSSDCHPRRGAGAGGLPGHHHARLARGAENGVPVPLDSVAAARGTHWTGTLSTPARCRSSRPNRRSTLGDELAGTSGSCFPAIPQGGVREGMEWTDTDQYHLVAGRVHRHRDGGRWPTAPPTADMDGAKPIPLETSSKYTRSGTRVQGEQELEMTATGTRNGEPPHRLDGALRLGPGERRRRDDHLGPRPGPDGARHPARAPTPSPRSRLGRPLAACGAAARRRSASLLPPGAVSASGCFAVWPPPLWYRTHWPAETEFMRTRRTARGRAPAR